MTDSMEYLPAIRKVHVVHDDTKQQSAPAKRKEYVVTPNSYPLTLGANPVQILAHSPKRCRATVVVNGSGVVAFGKTMADCQSAVANAAGEQTGNVFVINGSEFVASFQDDGTSELWAVLVSTIDPLVSNTSVSTTTYAAISQPAVPATGVNQQNVNSVPATVVINANGATITNVTVNGLTVGTGAGTYIVPAAGTISIAYTVATPTWTWTATAPPQTTTVTTNTPTAIPTVVSVLREIES